MIYISEHIEIDEDEITEDFVRSSGPGGQNVNKVATAVQLRFNVLNSPSLPDDVKKRLVKLAGKRMTEDGDLVLKAQRYRSQLKNREDALNRLIALIQKATEAPKPRKRKIMSRAAKARRLEEKRKQSEKKQRRKFDPRKDN